MVRSDGYLQDLDNLFLMNIILFMTSYNDDDIFK